MNSKKIYLHQFTQREFARNKGLFRAHTPGVGIIRAKLLTPGLFVSCIPLRPPVRIIDLPIWGGVLLFVEIVYATPPVYSPLSEADKKLRRLARYYTKLREGDLG